MVLPAAGLRWKSACALAAVLVFGAACSSNTPPTARQPGQPMRVLVIGDSLLSVGGPEYHGALNGQGYEIVGFHAVAGASMDDLLSAERVFVGIQPWTGPTFDDIVVDAASPDVVYLSFGTNDQHERKGLTVAEVLGDARQILDAFDDSCVVWQTWMSDISHLIDPPADYGERLGSFWDWVAGEADIVNDFGARLEAEPTLLAVDGVHPEPTGVAANATAMIEAIDGCGA